MKSDEDEVLRLAVDRAHRVFSLALGVAGDLLRGELNPQRQRGVVMAPITAEETLKFKHASQIKALAEAACSAAPDTSSPVSGSEPYTAALRKTVTISERLKDERSSDVDSIVELALDLRTAARPGWLVTTALIKSNHWVFPDIERDLSELKHQRRSPNAMDADDRPELTSEPRAAQRRVDSVEDHESNASTVNVDEASPSEVLLSQREREVLSSMLELGACNSDRRRSSQEIVVGSAGRETDVNAYKDVFRSLKDKKLVQAKGGRGGGYWLTQPGVERAKVQ